MFELATDSYRASTTTTATYENIAPHAIGEKAEKNEAIIKPEENVADIPADSFKSLIAAS